MKRPNVHRRSAEGPPRTERRRPSQSLRHIRPRAAAAIVREAIDSRTGIVPDRGTPGRPPGKPTARVSQAADPGAADRIRDERHRAGHGIGTTGPTREDRDDQADMATGKQAVWTAAIGTTALRRRPSGRPPSGRPPSGRPPSGRPAGRGGDRRPAGAGRIESASSGRHANPVAAVARGGGRRCAMIVHVVLFSPRRISRSRSSRTARRAASLRPTEIPSIRSFRVGKRVQHGLPGYEQMMRDDYEFVGHHRVRRHGCAEGVSGAPVARGDRHALRDSRRRQVARLRLRSRGRAERVTARRA